MEEEGVKDYMESLDEIQGTDQELIKLREKMPEPYYTVIGFNEVYYVPIPRQPQYEILHSFTTMGVTEHLKIEGFRMVRIALPDGGCFYAWEANRDRKIYF